jgi:hypothetical protein
MYDLSKDFFERLAVGPNNSLVPPELPYTPETRERASAEPPDAQTDDAVLDAAGLHSLHQMFQLLDEWDRAMEISSSSPQNSSEECEISVDRKTC